MCNTNLKALLQAVKSTRDDYEKMSDLDKDVAYSCPIVAMKYAKLIQEAELTHDTSSFDLREAAYVTLEGVSKQWLENKGLKWAVLRQWERNRFIDFLDDESNERGSAWALRNEWLEYLEKAVEAMVMWTYKDFMHGRCTHDDFYEQFVTERAVKSVETTIGLPVLIKSDRYLNSPEIKFNRGGAWWVWDSIIIDMQSAMDAGAPAAASTKTSLAKAAGMELLKRNGYIWWPPHGWRKKDEIESEAD